MIGKEYKNKEGSIIRAIQFNGWNWAECYQFMNDETMLFPQMVMYRSSIIIDISSDKPLKKVFVDDYIVKDPDGECNPCDFETFQNNYEEIKE